MQNHLLLQLCRTKKFQPLTHLPESMHAAEKALWRAVYQLFENKLPDCAEQLTQSKTQYPEHLEIFLCWAVLMCDLGKSHTISVSKLPSLEYPPYFEKLYLQIAIGYIHQKNFTKSQEYLRKVYHTKDFEYWYQSITIFLHTNQLERYRLELLTLLQSHPTRWEAYLALGKVYFMIRDFINAEKYYTLGLKYDPNNFFLQKALQTIQRLDQPNLLSNERQ